MKNRIEVLLAENLDFDNITIKQAIEILQSYPLDASIYYKYLGYDNSYDITVKTLREETDIEYEERLKREEMQNARNKQYKLDQYNILKKELGL